MVWGVIILWGRGHVVGVFCRGCLIEVGHLLAVSCEPCSVWCWEGENAAILGGGWARGHAPQKKRKLLVANNFVFTFSTTNK